MKGKISRETSDFLRCKPYFPIYLSGNISGGNHNSWKLIQTAVKKSSKFTKNHTCRWYDDTQSCNISCPNSTSFVRYKNNKFQTNHLDNFLAWNLFLFEICYFYISQTKSSLDKIFYKIVYHHIVYMGDFFVNLDDFFFVLVYMSFHKVMVCTRYIPDHISRGRRPGTGYREQARKTHAAFKFLRALFYSSSSV